ncbi:MAG TPA: hypothetical protein VES70_19155, partial [Pseudomonas sp.]|nr:hypothetical protein [Pseudomonas sp.]
RLQQTWQVYGGQHTIDAFVVQNVHGLTRLFLLFASGQRAPQRPSGRARWKLVLPVFRHGTVHCRL